VGIGGDPVIGTNFVDCLELFEEDPHTDQVVIVGEIGGNEEEKAAGFVQNEMTKPVYAYIAGKSAPENRRMGHAGAIIEGNTGSAESKITAFKQAGVKVVSFPEEIATLIAAVLKQKGA
jgi:succinyl-CoA synthetase alpha subunit